MTETHGFLRGDENVKCALGELKPTTLSSFSFEMAGCGRSLSFSGPRPRGHEPSAPCLLDDPCFATQVSFGRSLQREEGTAGGAEMTLKDDATTGGAELTLKDDATNARNMLHKTACHDQPR